MTWQDDLYAQQSLKKGAPQEGRPLKYRNTVVRDENGKKLFDSKQEAQRWHELLLMSAHGLIQDLDKQVRFPLEWNGVLICTYVADFVYTEKGQRVVEDAKGMLTPEYRLKKKMMLACHGIEIRETYARRRKPRSKSVPR